MSTPSHLTLPSLSHADIRHGFFTRNGGLSEGIYASLNCGFGSGDRSANVEGNRALVARTLAAQTLVTPYQVHSPLAVIVEAPWPREAAPQADALVTRVEGIALGVLSADCVPILFADAAAGVIGAAHAGWKGALGGVLEATVAAMITLGASPSGIVAGIGPAIQRKSYEVGPEFLERFAGAERFFVASERPGHWMFDLPGYVAGRLRALALGSVEDTGVDTLTEETRCFSYRRATRRGEISYGRMISAIVRA